MHTEVAGPVSARVLERMCAAMEHRGPDGRGMHVHGAIGLAMQRLSIIDLPGGMQPIYNEDRSMVIVFNGEIYNYRELRRELLAKGHTFRTDGDTETILHLYEEMGAACVGRLRGMFAFAIWDSRAHRLFLARDRFGIKPLYVTRGPWGLAFASELKCLHAAGLTSGQLDWDALDVFFQLGYIASPATPFRGVRKLEPGYTMLWRSSGDVTTTRYWDLPDDQTPSPPDVERQVLEWLDDSVNAHMVSDVPVAAFLSGGLDSSAVVSSMAMTGERPHAFTARYGGTGASHVDESELAAGFARRYNAALTVVDIRPHVAGIFEDITWALDEPHADDSAIPTWALSKAVAGSYRVALTGIGGDELFGGYWRHIGVMLGDTYSRLPRALQRAAAITVGTLREPSNGALGLGRAKRFLRAGGVDFADRFLGYVTLAPSADRLALYGSELRPTLTGDAARTRLRNLYLRGGARGGLMGGLYLDYKTFLPDDVLALSDRIAMAHSLEVRVPMVDHELVERVFRLPERAKVRWWTKKLLLKQALKDRISREQLRAPKRGFVGPTSSWLRNELRPMLQDELSSDRLKRLGYFDPAAVQRWMGEHFDRRSNNERILWALLCFSTWHRLYVEGSKPRSYRPGEASLAALTAST